MPDKRLGLKKGEIPWTDNWEIDEVPQDFEYVYVPRPRRFGKSMAARMLCTYYDREADSRSLFEKCKISKYAGEASDLKWDKYFGKFDGRWKDTGGYHRLSE